MPSLPPVPVILLEFILSVHTITPPLPREKDTERVRQMTENDCKEERKISLSTHNVRNLIIT